MKSFFRFKDFARPALCIGIFGVFNYHPNMVKLDTQMKIENNYHKYLHDAINQKLNEDQRFQQEFSFYDSLKDKMLSQLVAIVINNYQKVINHLFKLLKDVAKCLNVGLGKVIIKRFNDGECNIQVIDSIRGRDIYIIQSTSPPVNENLMELLLLVTTLRRASARQINVVIPYYGYSRQDRKTQPRVPISAADVAHLLQTVGIDRLISVDLHCGQIQGFFGHRVPVDNLQANLVFLNYLNHQKINYKDIVVVSPDAGGVERAKKFQDQLRSMNPDCASDIGLAVIVKQRAGAGQIGQMDLVGAVENKDAIIIDDIIDTAGTLNEAGRVLKKMGAKRVLAFATHGLFSGKAFQNIQDNVLDEVVVTNTIPQKNLDENKITKLKRLSIAPLIAQAIYRIQNKESITELFQSLPEQYKKDR